MIIKDFRERSCIAWSEGVDVRALAAGVYLVRVVDGLSPLAVKTFVVE